MSNNLKNLGYTSLHLTSLSLISGLEGFENNFLTKKLSIKCSEYFNLKNYENLKKNFQIWFIMWIMTYFETISDDNWLFSIQWLMI